MASRERLPSSLGLQAARAIGVAASLACLALWLVQVGVAVSERPRGVGPGTYVVFGLMMLLAAAGVVASFRAAALALALVAIASFLPVGLYLLGTPGPAKWIGVLDLGMLAAAAGISIARRLGRP